MLILIWLGFSRQVMALAYDKFSPRRMTWRTSSMS